MTETNVGRLERIKILDQYMGKIALLESDYDWLIEQAERVQKCENDFEKLLAETAKVDGQYATLHREWRNQSKEIKRLSKALELHEENKQLKEHIRNFENDSDKCWVCKQADCSGQCVIY